MLHNAAHAAFGAAENEPSEYLILKSASFNLFLICTEFSTGHIRVLSVILSLSLSFPLEG